MEKCTSGIVVAGGKGRRMGANGNKLLLELGGKPIIAHTLEIFQKSQEIDQVVLVVGAGEIAAYQKEIIEKYHFDKVSALVEGGEERVDSVYRGLLVLDKRTQWIVIHDGARPFVTEAILQRTLEAAKQTGAAIVGVPVKDTIKIANAQRQVAETPPREKLWAIQTPQAFRLDWIKEAYEQNTGGAGITDDAMLVESLGYPVQIVMGDYENIKMTTPEDLLLGEAILKKGEMKRCE